MTKARELSDYTGLQGDITAGDTAARAGRKNLIINGSMQVAQRGTTDTLVNGSGGYKAVDRWVSGETGASSSEWTITQDTDAPSGFASSLKWDCTTADTSVAADTYLYADTRLEGQDLQHLNYGTSDALQTAFSFWVKSNKTGTYVIWHRQADATRHWQHQYIINAADTWEKKTYVIPADISGTIANDNGNGFLIRFIFSSGTDFTSGTAPTAWTADVTANRYVGQAVNLADSTANYINITGVQLELGSVATDFEHRSYGEELALCQRYYNTSGIVLSNGTPYRYHNQINLPVEMRASPSITTAAVDSGSGGTIVPTWDRENNNSSSKVFYQGANHSSVSSGRFTFDAEL